MFEDETYNASANGNNLIDFIGANVSNVFPKKMRWNFCSVEVSL